MQVKNVWKQVQAPRKRRKKLQEKDLNAIWKENYHRKAPITVLQRYPVPIQDENSGSSCHPIAKNDISLTSKDNMECQKFPPRIFQ